MSELIENRCIVCNSDKISGDIPVCKACQDRQVQVKDTIINEITVKKRVDRIAIAKELDVPKVVVDWYIKTVILPDKYKERLAELSKSNLTVAERIYGENMWLEAGGKIDSMNAEKLKKHIDGLINDGWKHMVLDMGGIGFFSSTGIRVVLATYKRLTEEEGSFHIENPSQNVKNVLGMVALNQLLLR